MPRTSYPVRLWRELGSRGTEPDLAIRFIIVERIAKALLLIGGALVVVVLGREQVLSRWALAARDQLNLGVPIGFFHRLLDELLVRVGFLQHLNLIALAVILYALVEGTEGVGLALRRRWAEYLTVLATGFFIPYELLEVIHKSTIFRVGALLLNIAIVVYLAYRKRLFIDV